MLTIIKPSFAFERITIEHIPGLLQAMKKAMSPLREHLLESIYWNDLDLEESEYKRRDGFIPYAHNCGGIELSFHVLKCEELPFIDCGECDDSECDHDQSCSYEDEGHLDAHCKIWLKFEGMNDSGDMEFYLVCSGSNNDAPYFREKYQPTLFERSFTVKTLFEFKKESAKHIDQLIGFTITGKTEVIS